MSTFFLAATKQHDKILSQICFRVFFSLGTSKSATAFACCVHPSRCEAHVRDMSP
jgi:hypothetical protein